MPVIGTSGALTYNKVSTNTTETNWVFYLDGNVAGYGQPRIEDIDFVNKTLVTSITYATGNSSNITPGAISISQDFSTPLIGNENNYLLTGNSSTNYTFFVPGASVGGVFIGKNSGNTQILLTGGAYREVSNVTTNTGSAFSSTDMSFTFINKALVDNSPSSSSLNRVGTSVLSDSTGNYYIAGWVNEPSSGTGSDYCPYITKYNGSTNAKIWTKVCRQANAAGGSGLSASTPAVDIKFDGTGSNIVMMAAGPVIAASPTNYNKLLSFNNSTGALNWQLRMAPNIGSFDVDSNNNIYVVVQNLVQKYNSSRVLQWSKEYKSGTTTLTLPSYRNLKRRIFFRNNVLYVLTQISGQDVLLALDPSNGNISYSRSLGTYSWSGITLDNNNLYINVSYNYILKVPIDGTIPGNGIYTTPVGTLSYQSISLTANANSSYSYSAGNLTVSNANTTSITDWANNISTSSNIRTYGNITI